MWLDFAEDQTLRRKQVFYRTGPIKLDQFLSFNDRDVLNGAGKISKKDADDKAKLEFDRFAQQRRRLKAEGARSQYRSPQGHTKKINSRYGTALISNELRAVL